MIRYLIRSKLEADEEMKGYFGKQLRMLSIDNPGSSWPKYLKKFGATWYTRLEFHDISREKYDFIHPDKSHIKIIIKFIRDILEEKYDGDILIHCHAGVSRSTAAAYICLCEQLGPGKEKQALDHIFEIRPKAQPNKLMVQIADGLLGRNGNMIGALKVRRHS